MSVHKIGRTPQRRRTQPPSIQWKPRMEVEFKPVKLTPTKWKIYNQNKMIIKAKEIKIISLRFGVEMSSGTTFVSIKPELSCIILDGIFLDSARDLIVSTWTRNMLHRLHPKLI